MRNVLNEQMQGVAMEVEFAQSFQSKYDSGHFFGRYLKLIIWQGSTGLEVELELEY